MNCPFNDGQLTQLKAFVTLCKAQPTILNHPKLDFFKDYLESLGVKIPAPAAAPTFEQPPPSAPSGDTASNEPEETATSSGDESGPESDVELDMDGVIISEPVDESQEMGDTAKEVTDEERDQSDEKRSEAMKAFSEQQYDEAIKLYTEAIKLNPQSALLFAKRGQVYLKKNKLESCIKDCTHALELNCDSAAAYKFRGRAYRLLGKFEDASHDLCESLKIDYEDQTNEWLNEVKPNAEKLRQHKLTVQRKKEDKEHSEKLRRLRKAQAARAQAAQAQKDLPKAPPAAAGQPDLMSFLSDPDIVAAFQDPEIASALTDVSANPANFSKYQGNPKVLAAMEMFLAKLGQPGLDAAAGGAPNFNIPGFPSFGGGMPAGAKPHAPGDDDVGLD